LADRTDCERVWSDHNFLLRLKELFGN
jgi:hypothetical protein